MAGGLGKTLTRITSVAERCGEGVKIEGREKPKTNTLRFSCVSRPNLVPEHHRIRAITEDRWSRSGREINLTVNSEAEIRA